MEKRKETVTKILAILNGLSYKNSMQILDEVVQTIGDSPIIMPCSNTTAQSAYRVYSQPSAVGLSLSLEIARKRCDTCPGKFARYSAILDELPEEYQIRN